MRLKTTPVELVVAEHVLSRIWMCSSVGYKIGHSKTHLTPLRPLSGLGEEGK